MVPAQIVHQCQPKGGEDKCYKNKPRLSEVGLQPSNALASLNKSGEQLNKFRLTLQKQILKQNKF